VGTVPKIARDCPHGIQNWQGLSPSNRRNQWGLSPRNSVRIQNCHQLLHLLHPYYTISRGTSAAPHGDAASSRVIKTDARRQTLRTSSELQFCQIGDDALRLHGNGDDLQDKVDDVALVAAFGKPLVRIVDDAGILVGRYLIPLNHPLDRALAVDDVVIGGKRYGFDIVTSQPRKDHQTPTATSVCSRDAPAD